MTISVDGETLATVVADDQGNYSGTVVVDLPAGNYTATATCGDLVQTAPLNVRGVSESTTTTTAPAPAPAPGPGVGGQGGGSPLPRTGSNTTSLVLVGGLLLAGGGAMVVARKRFA